MNIIQWLFGRKARDVETDAAEQTIEVSNKVDQEQLIDKALRYRTKQGAHEYPEDLVPYLQFINDALDFGFVPYYEDKQRPDLCELVTLPGDPRHAHISVSVIGTPYISVHQLKERRSALTSPPFDWHHIVSGMKDNSSYH